MKTDSASYWSDSWSAAASYQVWFLANQEVLPSAADQKDSNLSLKYSPKIILPDLRGLFLTKPKLCFFLPDEFKVYPHMLLNHVMDLTYNQKYDLWPWRTKGESDMNIRFRTSGHPNNVCRLFWSKQGDWELFKEPCFLLVLKEL